jgi:hypothetical protein
MRSRLFSEVLFLLRSWALSRFSFSWWFFSPTQIADGRSFIASLLFFFDR